MASGLESDVNNEEWMKTLPEELWDIPLTNLTIPGGKTGTLIVFTLFLKNWISEMSSVHITNFGNSKLP